MFSLFSHAVSERVCVATFEGEHFFGAFLRGCTFYFWGVFMIVTFCGHSDFVQTQEYEGKILDFLEEKIGDAPAELYLGGYGSFDAFARRCGKKFQETHPNTKLIFITPYITIDYQKNHLDYNKDLAQLKTNKDIPVLYKKNETNDIFELTYLYDMGNRHDKALGTAVDYLEYLGTSDMTPEEVKSQFHQMGCGFSVTTGGERTRVSLSGLNENMPQALALLEKLLGDAQVNKEAYINMANDILKSRRNAKLNQSQNFSRLNLYAQWGPKNNATKVPIQIAVLRLIPCSSDKKATMTSSNDIVDVRAAIDNNMKNMIQKK